MNSKITRYLPFVFALIFFLQGYFGSLSKSLTWDEPVFIASGYSYLTRNDFRMNTEAPPLLQILQATPLLTLPLRQVNPEHPVWQKADHIINGKFFIQANESHLYTIAHRARLPILFLGALLIVTLFYWGKKLYGTTPAIWASALAACSPNLLAHAKLATTDLGCTAFMFFATYAFWHAIHNTRWQTWGICGLITGLALLTKYTALLLGPIYIILGLYCVWQTLTSLRQLIIGGGIVLLISLLTIGAGYNFSMNPTLYFEGLQKIYANANVGYQFYLLGNVSDHPYWYYYIIAFLIKTPIATLLILSLSLILLIQNPQNKNQAIFLLVPAGIVFFVSCFDQSNLGYRRILPALPFLLLFCAQAFHNAPSRLRQYAPMTLLCFTLLESVAIYPHHLSFFNQAVGGPKQGPYLLDDSNIDWGQDLIGLAKWQQNHPQAKPLRQMYFGLLPPQLYGVQTESLPLNSGHIRDPQPGYYAISAHHLAWFRKIKHQHNLDIDWLTKYHPVERIGYSIYIYKFPDSAQK